MEVKDTIKCWCGKQAKYQGLTRAGFHVIYTCPEGHEQSCQPELVEVKHEKSKS